MRKVALLLGVIAALVVIGCSGESKDNSLEAQEATDENLGFGVPCDKAWVGYVDPIVNPGGTAMHEHLATGDNTLNANSTNADLRADIESQAGTTCDVLGDMYVKDHSGYWIPSMGVELFDMIAYYKPDPVTKVESLQPYPEDLKVVAGGKMGSTSYSDYITWGCQGSPGSATTPIDCGTKRIKLQVLFPDCSNGQADSADHRTHMVYSNRGKCPSAYPTKVSQLHQHWIFEAHNASEINPADPLNFKEIHADFMNGWDREALKDLLQRCITDGTGCERDGMTGSSPTDADG